MPTFKLNGQEIPFEPGDTIIRAAWRQGFEIPHYCWHPGLSVAANCRMCLVEIKVERPMAMPILKWDESKNDYVPATKPKLSPACQIPAAEGMDVWSHSDEAKEAQASVQEFLLLNHPVDCPICDQAGECKLQDYWLDHQARLKRKLTEPVHKPKAVRFGPTIVYDGERCIMCTRCIRVSDELAKDHVLDMRERGNRNEIFVSPGRELDHDYTLMTEHVCPVGALTSRDFRFKARVWFLRAVPSVCDGCATGCNSFMDYDPRYNRVERLRPRDNEDVNKYWMCDDGMMTYKRTSENRILGAHSGRSSSTPQLLSPAQGLSQAASALLEMSNAPTEIGVVLSAQHSNEDNVAMVEFARRILKVERFYLGALPGWRGDDILRNPDNNPNRRGAEFAARQTLRSLADLLADIKSGQVKAVLALGSLANHGVATAEDNTYAELGTLKQVIVLASHHGPLTQVASLVVPIAAHGEVDGTFINAQGIHQSFKRAIRPPAGVSEAWKTLDQLATAMRRSELHLADLASVRALLPQKPKAAAASQTTATV